MSQVFDEPLPPAGGPPAGVESSRLCAFAEDFRPIARFYSKGERWVRRSRALRHAIHASAAPSRKTVHRSMRSSHAGQGFSPAWYRTSVSPPTTKRAFFAWVIVCLVWGTTYLAIRIALETIPPMS